MIPDDSEFCQYCGSEIEKPQEPKAPKCEKCGNTLPLDSDFCQYCGNRILKYTAENPSQKTRYYCSNCGGLIDNNSRICTQCGKQHFKGFSSKVIVAIILAVLLVVSIVVSMILYIQNTKLQDTIEELEVENQQYYDYWVESFEQIAFFDKYVVFVEDDGTNWYHKYGCYRFTGDGFWVYSIKSASYQGYEPCPYCCD